MRAVFGRRNSCRLSYGRTHGIHKKCHVGDTAQFQCFLRASNHAWDDDKRGFDFVLYLPPLIYGESGCTATCADAVILMVEIDDISPRLPAAISTINKADFAVPDFPHGHCCYFYSRQVILSGLSLLTSALRWYWQDWYSFKAWWTHDIRDIFASRFHIGFDILSWQCFCF